MQVINCLGQEVEMVVEGEDEFLVIWPVLEDDVDVFFTRLFWVVAKYSEGAASEFSFDGLLHGLCQICELTTRFYGSEKNYEIYLHFR